jgi:hypothetical protein
MGAKSGLYGGWSSISELKFCSKFWVFCAVCHQYLTRRRITPLLRLDIFSWWPAASLLVWHTVRINCAYTFQEVYQPYIQWVPENNAQHCASRWCPGWAGVFPLHGWPLTSVREKMDSCLLTSNDPTDRFSFYCITLHQTGHHSCCFVAIC